MLGAAFGLVFGCAAPDGTFFWSFWLPPLSIAGWFCPYVFVHVSVLYDPALGSVAPVRESRSPPIIARLAPIKVSANISGPAWCSPSYSRRVGSPLVLGSRWFIQHCLVVLSARAVPLSAMSGFDDPD
jgi:hypothetical protein